MKPETFFFKVAPLMVIILFCMASYSFYMAFTSDGEGYRCGCPKQEINHNNYGDRQ